MTATRKGPLSRFKVIDLTRARAGPTAARHFADFGADVIKIEMPAAGDEDALGGDREGPDFFNLHRNKRSLTLNLKTAEGVAILKKLATTADVLIENYRPDVKRRLGIDYETLRAINPRLVNKRALETMAIAAPRYVAEWHDLAIGRAVRRELDRFQPEALLVHGMTPWGVTALRIGTARAIPVGVIEVKKQGTTLSTVADQSGHYAANLPPFLADKLPKDSFGPRYSTFYRKLLCHYDYLAFRWVLIRRFST